MFVLVDNLGKIVRHFEIQDEAIAMLHFAAEQEEDPAVSYGVLELDERAQPLGEPLVLDPGRRRDDERLSIVSGSDRQRSAGRAGLGS